MQGDFDQDILKSAKQALYEEFGIGADFSEHYDFGATCERPDGTRYGISGGQCRKGREVKPAEKKKRGRPKGVKNRPKAEAPKDTAERMKKAFDKMVGIDLSKTMVSAKSEKEEQKSMLDLTKAIKARDALKAKKNELGDKLDRLRGPSGELPTENQAEWKSLSKKWSVVNNQLAKANKEVSFQLNERALGRQAIPISEKPEIKQIDEKLRKNQEAREGVARRINELRPLDSKGQYVMPSKERDKVSLENAYKANGKLYSEQHKLENDKRRAMFDARNTELQKAQRDAKEIYKELHKADKELKAELARAGGPYGSKPAEALERRNILARQFADARARYDKLVANKEKGVAPDSPSRLMAKELSEARKVQDKLGKEEVAAFNKYMQVSDRKGPEGRKLREEWREKAKRAVEADKEVERLNDKLKKEAANEVALASKTGERWNIKDAKVAAREFAEAIKQGKKAGISTTELEEELRRRVQDIKNLQEPGKIALAKDMSARDGALTRAYHRNVEPLQRGRRLAEMKMDELNDKIRAEADPAKRAELMKKRDEARDFRNNMVKELNRSYAELKKERQAARLGAQQMMEAQAQSARNKREANLQVSVQKAQNEFNAREEKVVKIRQELDKLNKQIDDADKLQREAQERANKYASVIRNAKSPSEKELLNEALKKRNLGQQMQDAMKMRDDAEAARNKLMSELNVALKNRDKAENVAQAAIQKLQKAQAGETLANPKTVRARENVRMEDRNVEMAVKSGTAQILNSNKPDYNWNIGSGSGSKALGDPGAFGSAFKVPGPPPGTVKVGQIGEKEPEAMNRAFKAGVGPEPFKAARDPGAEGRRDYGVNTRVGKMAYEFVEGKEAFGGKSPWEASAGPDVATRDKIWAARAKLHKGGVAHEDMHPGNIIINKGEVKFIDFGLAKVGNKPALAEALGVGYVPGEKGQAQWGRGGDEQVVRWGQLGKAGDGKVPPNLERILRNRSSVRTEMLRDGFTNEEIKQFMEGKNFRQPDSHFETRAWGRMSDDLAVKYIDILYKGVE